MRQIEDKIVYKEIGRETINGIACKHYTYSGEATVQIAEGALKGEAWVRGQGESWVADQPGLPPVVIRNSGVSEMKMKAPSGSGATGDIDVAMNVETELYDINTPITIKPPTDVFTPPAPSAGSTVRPTPTRGRRAAGDDPSPLRPSRHRQPPEPTPAGETTTYDFDEPLDRSWYGQSGVDAEISVEARPGYPALHRAQRQRPLPRHQLRRADPLPDRQRRFHPGDGGGVRPAGGLPGRGPLHLAR